MGTIQGVTIQSPDHNALVYRRITWDRSLHWQSGLISHPISKAGGRSNGYQFIQQLSRPIWSVSYPVPEHRPMADILPENRPGPDTLH